MQVTILLKLLQSMQHRLPVISKIHYAEVNLMRDFLKELCKDLSINLIYEENQNTDTVLSSKVIENTPTIRASKIFFECPKEIAQAVVGYCTGSKDSSQYLKQIESYLDENLITIEYIIEPPDEAFKQLRLQGHKEKAKTDANDVKTSKHQKVGQSILPKKQRKTKNPEVPIEILTPELMEMEIRSIVQKNFWGSTTDLKINESLNASSDDVLELDIVIDQNDV